MGNQTSFVRYAGIGPDNAWFTGDDLIEQRGEITHDGNGMSTRSMTFSGAGPDGVWLTVDDLVSRYEKIVTTEREASRAILPFMVPERTVIGLPPMIAPPSAATTPTTIAAIQRDSRFMPTLAWTRYGIPAMMSCINKVLRPTAQMAIPRASFLLAGRAPI